GPIDSVSRYPVIVTSAWAALPSGGDPMGAGCAAVGRAGAASRGRRTASPTPVLTPPGPPGRADSPAEHAVDPAGRRGAEKTLAPRAARVYQTYFRVPSIPSVAWQP